MSLGQRCEGGRGQGAFGVLKRWGWDDHACGVVALNPKSPKQGVHVLGICLDAAEPVESGKPDLAAKNVTGLGESEAALWSMRGLLQALCLCRKKTVA